VKEKKKRVKVNLILGIGWLFFAVFSFVFKRNVTWFDYVWFLFSAIYFTIYFYQQRALKN
jgi:hypothetical protein